MVPISLAGDPATRVLGGTDLSTRDPAATCKGSRADRQASRQAGKGVLLLFWGKGASGWHAQVPLLPWAAKDQAPHQIHAFAHPAAHLRALAHSDVAQDGCRSADEHVVRNLGVAVTMHLARA